MAENIIGEIQRKGRKWLLEVLHWNSLESCDIKERIVTIINFDKFFRSTNIIDPSFEYYYIENITDFSKNSEIIKFFGRKALPSQLLSKKSSLYTINKKNIVQIEHLMLSSWQTYIPEFDTNRCWCNTTSLGRKYSDAKDKIQEILHDEFINKE